MPSQVSSSRVCVLKPEIIHWNSEFLLLHLNYFQSLLSLKASVWESIPECVCVRGHNWKQNSVICFFLSFSLPSWNFSCDISMDNCLSSIYSKKVIISTLFKRSLLDLFYFRYQNICFFALLKLSLCSVTSTHIAATCFICLISYYIHSSLYIALTPHYIYCFILQTLKLLMCLQHWVFSRQAFSFVQRGKGSNFKILLKLAS